MNEMTHIALSNLPTHGQNHAVTTSPDGSVLSRVFDLEWDFSGQEQGSLTGSQRVGFVNIIPEIRQEIQLTLFALIKKHKEQYDESATRSQVANWKIGLVNIRNILESSEWIRLSDDRVYKTFKSKLKKQIQKLNWGEGTVQGIVTAINKLNESSLCARKPDGGMFQKWVSKEREQHIAIPIGMYQSIIAMALSIVETYHPYRFEINEAQAQLEEIYRKESIRTDVSLNRDAIRCRVLNRVTAKPCNIPNFELKIDGSELNKILCACAIVTLAFSGVRVGELISMNKHSYEEKEANKIPTLKGDETKRDGRVIHETWQTHKVAKDALELAYDMTQFLRDMYKEKNNDNLKNSKITSETHQRHARQIATAFLSTSSSRISSGYCQRNLNRLFTRFVKNSGIVATHADLEEFNRLNPSREGQLKVGGTLLKLTPHDFRRSFAVFFKRYGFGSSATIKFQYKHSNIQMSDYYGNNARLQEIEDVLLDNDLLQLMNEEGIQMGVDIFDEIYNESENLGGAGGKRIAKDKFERLSSGEHVYMTRSEIERLVRNGTLSVVKLPTGGYCTNATCSRVCGIGEFSAEIKPCDNEVITDKQAKIILKQNKRLIKTFREMNTGDPMMNSILIGQKQKIQRNEQKIKDFNSSFEPFTDKVKGTIQTVEA